MDITRFELETKNGRIVVLTPDDITKEEVGKLGKYVDSLKTGGEPIREGFTRIEASEHLGVDNTPQPEHKSIEEIKRAFENEIVGFSEILPPIKVNDDINVVEDATKRVKVMNQYIPIKASAVWEWFLPHLNSRNLLEWATGNDTGVSSVALLRYMMGFEPNDWGFMAPSDRDDRGRCIRLLKKFPEWLDRLDEMKKFSGWKEQIPLIKDEFIESELGK